MTDYPTKWGNTTSAYISTCAAEIKVQSTNLGGYESVTYYVDELQPTSSNETQVVEVSFVNEYGSNQTSNEYVTTIVNYETLVPVAHTSNIIVPQSFAVICDASVYPSLEHRLQSPMLVSERTPVYATMTDTSNLSVFDYIYNTLGERFPNSDRY